MGELASEFQSGDYISAADISETGKYPVYGGNGLRGYTDYYNHEGHYALIGRQGALCGNVNSADGKAYFTEHAVVVQANHNNDTDFLIHLFGLMNLGHYSGQSAQPGLAVGVLKGLKACVPTKQEQLKISGYFNNLDRLITLHQRKRMSHHLRAESKERKDNGIKIQEKPDASGFSGCWPKLPTAITQILYHACQSADTCLCIAYIMSKSGYFARGRCLNNHRINVEREF